MKLTTPKRKKKQTTVIYGCQCVCSNHATGADSAPVAFLIERNGKELAVCTRCDCSSDTHVGRFYDANSPVSVFMDFDALGAFCMSAPKYLALPFVGSVQK